MDEALRFSQSHGVRAGCQALDLPPSSLYREKLRRERPAMDPRPRPASPRALSPPEKEGVVEVLHSRRFVDKAPATVWAELLDEGRYLCSIRTMYRILAQRLEVKERRRQRRHPQYAKPELWPPAPTNVGHGTSPSSRVPSNGDYYYLYRFWISSAATGGLDGGHPGELTPGQGLIAQSSPSRRSCGDLTLHADRGSSMSSKALALLLADLGVTKSHSRPHVCDDNPYSEAQFKTLKYRPEFPARFGTIQQARTFCREFFDWYNRDHRHSGIGLHTPEDVHYLRHRHTSQSSPNGGRPCTLRGEISQGKPVPTTLPKATLDQPSRKGRTPEMTLPQQPACGYDGQAAIHQSVSKVVDTFRWGQN